MFRPRSPPRRSPAAPTTGSRSALLAGASGRREPVPARGPRPVLHARRGPGRRSRRGLTRRSSTTRPLGLQPRGKVRGPGGAPGWGRGRRAPPCSSAADRPSQGCGASPACRPAGIHPPPAGMVRVAGPWGEGGRKSRPSVTSPTPWPEPLKGGANEPGRGLRPLPRPLRRDAAPEPRPEAAAQGRGGTGALGNGKPYEKPTCFSGPA